MPIFKFNKDYKGFKKGQYVELPDKRFTGQIHLMVMWEELRYLIKKGIVDLQDSSK